MVELRLRDSNGVLFKVEALLPTLLHEFAHCLTPGELHYGHNEDGKRSRKWHYIAHCEAFYANFAKILVLADRLDIFKLPNTPNKYSMRNLKRYDSIDVEVVPSYAMGTSPLYADAARGATSLSAPGNAQSAAASQQPLRLTLIGGGGARKPVVLKKRTLAAVRTAAAGKFRLNSVKRVLFEWGHPVQESDLLTMPQDACLVVAE